MALVIADRTLLREAVVRALMDHGGAAVMEPDHDDPFGAALRHEAIVYIPDSSLGTEESRSSPERMRAVLRAAHAPAVEVLVMVLPLQGFEDEVALLRRDGTPYVILRAPMLLEELGGELDTGSIVLVPRNSWVRTVGVDAVAQAVVAAIRSEDQGRTVELHGERLGAAAALERAARATGRDVRAVALWAPLLRALRWLARRFGRSEPPVLRALRRFALPPAPDRPRHAAAIERAAH